jgi:predicted nucleic acid-binding protein
MTDARGESVVVDTMVMSWLLSPRPNQLAERYRGLIGSRPVLLAFQTVAELRYGARRASWGELRRRRLERFFTETTILEPDDEMSNVYANLRYQCQKIGHPLAQKVHDGDRWIAAAAIQLHLPLVSHDAVFDGAPQLELITGGAQPTLS